MADCKLIYHEIGNKVSLTNASSEIPAGIKYINAEESWNLGNHGENVVIAVLDTGVYKDHPDLKDNIIGGKNFTTEYNSDPNNYHDGHYHGTHVCGTIAAIQNGTGVVGVAPKAKILAVKVLSNTGSGSWQSVINGIDYAISWKGENGEKVKIISMSLGGPIGTEALHNAVQRAIAAGISVVCAAGNEGDGSGDSKEVGYPAYYPECICVGSFNGINNVSTFSNSNDQIDLIAPGENVLSTSNTGSYQYLSGTSMATPHVSGALALIANHFREKNKREITETELFEELINSYTKLLPSVNKTLQGNGVLHLTYADEYVNIATMPFVEVLKWFSGYNPYQVMNSYDYWLENAQAGKMIKGDFVQILLKRVYVVEALNKIPR